MIKVDPLHNMAIKKLATMKSIPYQTLIRHWLAGEIKKELAMVGTIGSKRQYVGKRTMDLGKAILDEAKKGKYGTVVIGRRGVDRAFFMGSVSRHVLDKISERAVWVVS